jgi:hypothetical protein
VVLKDIFVTDIRNDKFMTSKLQQKNLSRTRKKGCSVRTQTA